MTLPVQPVFQLALQKSTSKKLSFFFTNSNFKIPISLEPDDVSRLYFKSNVYLTKFIV